MESSMNESEVQRSFRSPPRRRRSTFFIRRESTVPQPVSENENPNADIKEAEDTKRCIDMTRYYEMLLSEKGQWKKEVNERRNKYHDLREQYQIASKTSNKTIMSYSVLSNEDIEFLKAKPNVPKLIDMQQKLHKSVKETISFLRRANEMDDIILRNSERTVNAITDYIFENSTVGPMQE